jgi:predicted RND superfamily exporter protein
MQTSLKAAEKAGNMEGLAIQVVDEYDFMALGSYLAYSAFMSMLASLAIAVAVIFLLTRNLRLSLLASVCLYCIVSFVFGLMVVSGWSINLLEAVDISIAGGMSVDYLLHMVHSYNHNSGSSAERVRKALREMGVSVSMGIATTFIACCALLLTDMLWFRLFGVFIIMVVCSAFLTSMFGLMALLAQVGPSNRDASVEDEGGGNNETGNGGKGTATGEDKGGLEARGDSQPATMSDLEMIDMKRGESEESGGTGRFGGKDKRVSIL